MSFSNVITRPVSLEEYDPNDSYATTKTMADPLQKLKNGIWIYYLLLLFEGGFRKWFLPGLATPLLIIRDPVALWLILSASSRGLLKANFYIIFMVIITSLAVVTAVTIGHGNFMVAMYGARIFLIHFPLIFVIGRVFTREDVIKMGKVTLWISLPMTVLVAMQYHSPQSAWVNRGVGGEGSAGFNGGSQGYFRPPGTFSFTNGNVLYYSFTALYIFYFWIYPKSINLLLLITATACLIAAVPFSISRSLLIQVSISLLFLVLGISRKPEFLGKLIGAVLLGLAVIVIFSKTSFFQTSTMIFSERFEGANEAEGGLMKGVLGDRYLGGMLEAVSNSSNTPFFGYGIGLGTSVGAMILLGRPGLMISEDEWGRLIGEMGAIMGLSIIGLRLGLFIKMASASYKRLVMGDLLPWMLLSFGLFNIPQGQWAQPAGLGFGIMVGGLIFASFNTESEPEPETEWVSESETETEQEWIPVSETEQE
jgi:hypothetical protein